MRKHSLPTLLKGFVFNRRFILTIFDHSLMSKTSDQAPQISAKLNFEQAIGAYCKLLYCYRSTIGSGIQIIRDINHMSKSFGSLSGSPFSGQGN